MVDDILLRFDDERSLATLKVLAELSRKTQVIFFRITGTWWNWSRTGPRIWPSRSIRWVANGRIDPADAGNSGVSFSLGRAEIGRNNMG